MYPLVNALKCMNISSAVGAILTANEVNWVQKILDDDTGLFAAFNDPEGNTLNKTMWHGEFPGKLLTGIAQTYLQHRDEKTRAVGNRFVEAFKNAQREDGYLGPWPEKARFAEDIKADPAAWGKWDTWGHYHCIYGLLRWYQVTGERDALDVAVKAADCVYKYFIDGGVNIAAQKWAECNLAIGHAFALLYESDGDAKYLAAFKLYIRIPRWSESTALTVNGIAPAPEVKCGAYYVIDRTWNPGDVIELSLDMTPHFWIAEKGRDGCQYVSWLSFETS